MNEMNLLGEPRVFRANMLNLNRTSKNSSSSAKSIPSAQGNKAKQIDFANILKEVSSPQSVVETDVDNMQLNALGSRKEQDASGAIRQKNSMPNSSQLRFNNDTHSNVSRVSTDFVRSMYNALGKA
ncbi:MAG: hypothetical protein HQL71_08235 [Magnetococcales bacterium]|nr:hypothetical protein [Magnetococcales bacterium]